MTSQVSKIDKEFADEQKTRAIKMFKTVIKRNLGMTRLNKNQKKELKELIKTTVTRISQNNQVGSKPQISVE